MTTSSQSIIHATMNERSAFVLRACRWVVRFEELHTDIVTFLPGSPEIWAVENERRANAYWIRRNAIRNHRNGASGTIFVAETNAVAEKIQSIVAGLPDIVRLKIVVVVIDNFTEEFVRTRMERRQR